jgi:hypothetical protein
MNGTGRRYLGLGGKARRRPVPRRARAPGICEIDVQHVVQVRAFTDWRNAVSHAPKSLDALKRRDAKLRTMFEATRDLLLDWWGLCKPLGLLRWATGRAGHTPIA